MLKVFMTSIAEWGSGGSFAAAEDDGLLFGKGHDLRMHSGLFMIPVAKWLFLGLTAGTPGIPAGIDFNRVGVIVIFFCHNIKLKLINLNFLMPSIAKWFNG